MGTTLNKRCLILGGGDILDYAALIAELEAGDFILCADGGFLHCEKLGVKPDLLVGDFDSIGLIPDGVERLEYPSEKDYSDSTLAIRTAAARGFKTLILAGMLGGRFDHSLSNLQNLAWCVQNGISAHITDGVTRVFAVKNASIALQPKENTYFSVISLVTQCEAVTITGARYPLDAYPLRFDEPRAISNEYAGGEAVVTVKKGVAAIIETPIAPLLHARN